MEMNQSYDYFANFTLALLSYVKKIKVGQTIKML
jgi:hypothetical protein